MKRTWLVFGLLVLVAAPSAAMLLLMRTPASAAGGAASYESTLDADAAALRAKGPAAFEQLLAQRDALLKARKSAEDDAARGRYNEQLARLDALIDAVGAARYCTASRFYWYTDLDKATEAARQSGKPILSLRMMGRLTDEYSCANSRFFRTTLYANEEISRYLRDNFVLHWRSVRPVPKVTIDFGDGRKLERTLTGNSIHYVLDVDGRPLDALPGLYAPQKFLEELRRSHELFQQVSAARSAQSASASRDSLLVDYHRRRAAEVAVRWRDDLRLIAMADAATRIDVPRSAPQPQKPIALPRAEAAARIARPKGDVEMPVIRGIALQEAASLEAATDETMWIAIAARHAAEWKLDEASVRLIRSENPAAAQATKLTVTKALVEDPLVRMISNLESSIALDTVRNEYQLRREIHNWFVKQPPMDVEALNERVYAELFLTPSSDPWIGLVPDATYTGLENGGVVRSERK